MFWSCLIVFEDLLEGVFWGMSVGMLYDWGVVYNCEVGLSVPFLIGYIYGLLRVYLVIFFPSDIYIVFFSSMMSILFLFDVFPRVILEYFSRSGT